MIAAPVECDSVMSDSVMPPTPEWITRAATSSVRACRASDDGFERALHVRLDDERESLRPDS